MTIELEPGVQGEGGPRIAARIADLFAREDAAVRERLDFIVKSLGYCRYCRARLSEVSLARHPGVCGRYPCRDRARKDGEGHGS